MRNVASRMVVHTQHRCTWMTTRLLHSSLAQMLPFGVCISRNKADRRSPTKCRRNFAESSRRQERLLVCGPAEGVPAFRSSTTNPSNRRQKYLALLGSRSASSTRPTHEIYPAFSQIFTQLIHSTAWCEKRCVRGSWPTPLRGGKRQVMGPQIRNQTPHDLWCRIISPACLAYEPSVSLRRGLPGLPPACGSGGGDRTITGEQWPSALKIGPPPRHTPSLYRASTCPGVIALAGSSKRTYNTERCNGNGRGEESAAAMLPTLSLPPPSAAPTISTVQGRRACLCRER